MLLLFLEDVWGRDTVSSGHDARYYFLVVRTRMEGYGLKMDPEMYCAKFFLCVLLLLFHFPLEVG